MNKLLNMIGFSACMVLTFPIQSFAQSEALRPAAYDKNGRLITNAEQVAQDREAGILQRGGYNPAVAERAAKERQRALDAKNVPKLGNTNAPNSNAASARNIYRCKKGKAEVYADDENKYKFSQCQLVRRATSEQAYGENTPNYGAYNQSPPAAANPALMPEVRPATTPKQESTRGIPCSGAILYKGSTYIFNESEPCPIPESVFNNRKPIEAEPTYYTQ
ncbi:hypothetical protein [Suttonella ornithocola]|uniref:Uncharacterized protein n=1 Tax=Suttonella ornithocola TaxID=279832 RepID=A0A380MQN5_9GAMM|nr:hypothetical protein [Suttonella ornithocola]SUO93617.1 Uncharacterised protein [Suttonella ornithocola]